MINYEGVLYYESDGTEEFSTAQLLGTFSATVEFPIHLKVKSLHWAGRSKAEFNHKPNRTGLIECQLTFKRTHANFELSHTVDYAGDFSSRQTN